MRYLPVFPIFFLVACSESAAPPEPNTEVKPTEFAAGQWELTGEVTSFLKKDEGRARIDTPVGTKSSWAHCVPGSTGKAIPPELFAADVGACESRSAYVANGRMVVSLECRQPGLDGPVLRTLDGNFTADSLDAMASTRTQLASDGDVEIESKLTGRRTGDCPAATPETKG